VVTSGDETEPNRRDLIISTFSLSVIIYHNYHITDNLSQLSLSVIAFKTITIAGLEF